MRAERPKVRRAPGPTPAGRPAKPSTTPTLEPGGTPLVGGRTHSAYRQYPNAPCGEQAVLTPADARPGRLGKASAEVVVEGEGGGLGPIVDVELAVQVLDVPLDGALAQEELVRDIAVALARGDQL